MKKALLLIGLAAMPGLAGQANHVPDAPPPQRPTLTLAPSVVLTKIKPGQGWTQTLRMSNGTDVPFGFEIEVEDVVVKDGLRVYVPAGETDGGIAASAVASPRLLVIPPQAEGRVSVTLTIPPKTGQRAVVIYFHGKIENPKEHGSVGLGASLGALITFGMSDDYQLEAISFNTAPQSDAANQTISHQLRNTGSEVIIPKGAAAILDESGRRVAKITFDSPRLLPGELLTFSGVCPSQLKPGHYRVASSFEFEGRIITSGGEFYVP